MKAILAALGLVFLTGCATTLVPDTPFEALSNEARLTNRTIVTWERVSDVHKVCLAHGVKIHAGQVIHGCAFPGKTSCRIITGTTTTMPILGHELRHCFEGNFHD